MAKKDWKKYNKWKKSQKQGKSYTTVRKELPAQASNVGYIYHKHDDGTVHRHETLLDEQGHPRLHDHPQEAANVLGVEDLSGKIFKEMGGDGTIHDMLRKVKARSSPEETQWHGYVGY